MLRRALAQSLALSLAAALASLLACGTAPVTGAQATKPLSPAEGAGDYNPQTVESPGGASTTSIASGEPATTAGTIAPPPQPDCPPTCTATGAWTGCGLTKPRGNGNDCQKCAKPKCVKKPTGDEWYDCSGVLITMHACG